MTGTDGAPRSSLGCTAPALSPASANLCRAPPVSRVPSAPDLDGQHAQSATSLTLNTAQGCWIGPRFSLNVGSAPRSGAQGGEAYGSLTEQWRLRFPVLDRGSAAFPTVAFLDGEGWRGGKRDRADLISLEGGTDRPRRGRNEAAGARALTAEVPGQSAGRAPYAHAPITEAVVEFRVTARPTLTLDELNGLKIGEEENYPQVRPRFDFQGEFEVTDVGVNTSTKRTQTGYVFSRANGTQIFQARLDGFSFSQLPPYHGWESFSDEALRMWHRYLSVVQPLSVDRIGARYINRIDIPKDSIEIKDYLKVWPEVPPEMPQLLQGFFLQVGVPLPQFQAAVTINSTIVAPPEKVGTALVLDLDTYRVVQLNPKSDNFDDEVVTQLTSLRRAKNFVFESCITEETRRLIS